jgi:Raf kinase inhibitor-like YbhB/YbcL family protein
MGNPDLKGSLMNKMFCCLAVVPILFFCCEKKEKPAISKFQEKGDNKMTIKITSPAFAQGEMIPSKYTADGQNVSPPLKWEGVSGGTLSIALICDDPDAPMGTWVHWVMWNIPPDKKELPENVPPDQKLPDGSIQGITDFKRAGYGGPAPPSGTHRYYFKLYGLDTKLDLPTSSTKAQLLKAMEGHILSQGELMGKYKRQ